MRKSILNKLILTVAAMLVTVSAGVCAYASDGDILFSEDYEKAECTPLNSGTGVVETDEETGNKYIHVTGGWSASQFGYAIPEVKEGKIQVTFDYMKKDLSKQTYVVLANNNFYSGKEWLRLFAVSGAGVITSLTNADSMGKMKAEKWYTQKVVIDVDTKECMAELYEKGGEEPIATLHFDELPTNTSSYGYGGWPETSKSFVRIRHFGDNDGYLDNIEIKYIYDEPKLSSDNISIMTAQGDIQKNKQEVIASANIIKIDFKTYMDESTLTEENIYITKKGETEKITAALSTQKKGHKVSAILQTGQKWTPGDYTIHISENVKNIAGDFLTAPYEEDFCVISGKVAKVSFVYADKEANLTEGEKVNPEVEKIVFWLSGEVDREALSQISVAMDKTQVSGERTFNEAQNTYTITLDSYLKQKSKYSVKVPYEVVGNAYEGEFETGEGIYKVAALEFCDSDGNVTDDLSKISSITAEIINTSEQEASYSLMFTAFSDNVMKNMQYKDFEVLKSDSKVKIVMPVMLADGVTSVKKLLWTKNQIEETESEKDFADCDISEDGVVKAEGTFGKANENIRVFVFRPGKSSEDLVPDSENILNIAYCDILVSGENGEYSIEFAIDSEPGFYDVIMLSESGETKAFTVFYNDTEKSAQIRGMLNLAEDKDSFYNILCENDNFKKIGFYAGVSETVDTKKVSDLLYTYVKETSKLPEDDNEEAIRIFRKMYAIALLNESKTVSVSEFEDYLNIESEDFKDFYNKAYMTERVKKEIFDSLLNKKFKSNEDYTEAILKQIVLKTVRYSDGYGNIRDILKKYESETGIKTSSLGSDNYSEVLGKRYNNYSELEDAIKAKKNTGNGSSGGSGGGGGSSSKKPSVSITVGNSYIPKPDAATVEKEQFIDIADYVWAKDAIENLNKNGVVSGKEEKMFCPADSITREEFVTMLVRAKGVDYKTSDVEFLDVDKNAWYAKYIGAAVADGIVNGKADGSFGIGEKISRQDMAVMLYRALKMEKASNNDGFLDDTKIADYAKDAVYTMRDGNIISGFEDGSFRPDENATRAQAAVMLNRGFYN